MKPKMFGSGTAAPKFSAGKPSGKKAMPGRRMQIGGALEFEPPPEDRPVSLRGRPGAQFSDALRAATTRGTSDRLLQPSSRDAAPPANDSAARLEARTPTDRRVICTGG